MKLGIYTIAADLPLLGAVGIVIIAAWRKHAGVERIRRYRREGRCDCGYDLRGHRDAMGAGVAVGRKCPECGRGIRVISGVA